jgi:hypothetical protein
MRLTYKDGDNTYYAGTLPGGGLCFLRVMLTLLPAANEDMIKTVQDKYQIPVLDYYKSTCDCAMNGDGEPSKRLVLKMPPMYPLTALL